MKPLEALFRINNKKPFDLEIQPSKVKLDAYTENRTRLSPQNVKSIPVDLFQT